MDTNTRLWMITLAVAVGSLLLSALLYVLFDVVVILFLFIPPAVYGYLRRRNRPDGG